MESISSASSTNLFRTFHLPKHSPLPRHPRSLVVCVQTEAKPSARTSADTDKKASLVVEDDTSTHALKSAKKPATVQSFVSLSSKDVPASRALATLFCNVIDDIINNFIEKPLRPSVDPKFVLAGNFAPVKETRATECLKIRGTLPTCLDGVYIRNGPNPSHLPLGGYHSFDGDGMLHALRIRNGRLTFCSRFVRTNKYVGESNARGPVMPNVFSGFHGVAGLARGALFSTRIALGFFNPLNGCGLANSMLKQAQNITTATNK